MSNENFLAERKAGFGGSDAHKYMSAGRYGCVRAVTYEKAGIQPDYPFSGSDATDRGTFLEDKAGSLYAAETNRKIWRRAKQIRHREDTHLTVHIDRHIVASDANVDQDGLAFSGPGVLEIKTMGERVYRKFLEVGLPIGYQLQLQHAMCVTGWLWGSFAVYWPDGHKLRAWDVRRDEALIAEMRAKAGWAWGRVEEVKRLIQIGQPIEAALPERLPADTEKCRKCGWRTTCQGAALLEKFGDGFEQTENYDESLTPLVREYKSLSAELAPKNKRLEELEGGLKKAMSDRLIAECSAGRVSYKTQKKGKAVFRVLRVR